MANILVSHHEMTQRCIERLWGAGSQETEGSPSGWPLREDSQVLGETQRPK